MGGRGASSGMSDKGKPYGSEYHAILQEGNIKFVVPNDGATKAPMETMTRNRVYVTVNPKYGPVYITYHDAENKRTKTIDLQHTHRGEKPHVHHGYEHNERDGPKGATGLSPKERKMVERVWRIWYNWHGKS